jgi:hypothetical protein
MLFSCGGVIGGPAVGHLEAVAAVAVVLPRLVHLLPGIHDEGAVPRHRLAVRPSCDQHDPRALARCIAPHLHAVAVATEHDERARGSRGGGVTLAGGGTAEGGLAVDDVRAGAPPARDRLAQARAGPQGDVEAQRRGAGPERGARAEALARDNLDGDAAGVRRGGGGDVVARQVLVPRLHPARAQQEHVIGGRQRE